MRYDRIIVGRSDVAFQNLAQLIHNAFNNGFSASPDVFGSLARKVSANTLLEGRIQIPGSEPLRIDAYAEEIGRQAIDLVTANSLRETEIDKERLTCAVRQRADRVVTLIKIVMAEKQAEIFAGNRSRKGRTDHGAIAVHQEGERSV